MFSLLPTAAAGDMYVGRTVAGLPMSTADGCVLPPFFVMEDDNGNAKQRQDRDGAEISQL